MAKFLRTIMSIPLMVVMMLVFYPSPSRADDDQPSDSTSSADQSSESSSGTVEQPDNVTSAPSDEGASERAGAGFDTPWTSTPYNDGKADNLEPKPFSATPND